MSVASVDFLVAILFVATLIFALPTVRLRQALLSLCSLGFLATYIPNVLSGVVLAVFLLSGYGCARLLRAVPSRGLFVTYLMLLLGAFTYLKKYEVLKYGLPEDWLNHAVGVVGLSYMLFRQIHFIVDSMQSQIEESSLFEYINYQINPFTLLAGPIERYQQFRDHWQRLTPVLADKHEVLKNYRRLFSGMLKVVLFSKAFQSVYTGYLGQLLSYNSESQIGASAFAIKWIVMLYAYYIYMYFNFSGYCDVVIAAGNLVGIRLPENFNWPFLSRNLLEYWTRWHITLGLWIRDYIFTPLYKAGAERWPERTPMLAVVSYFVAFSLSGIWHGSTWNFLIWGVLHGIGISTAKLWELAIIKRVGRSGLKRYLKSPAIRIVSILATFHYVCFTLFFFALDLTKCQQIFSTFVKILSTRY